VLTFLALFADHTRHEGLPDWQSILAVAFAAGAAAAAIQFLLLSGMTAIRRRRIS